MRVRRDIFPLCLAPLYSTSIQPHQGLIFNLLDGIKTANGYRFFTAFYSSGDEKFFLWSVSKLSLDHVCVNPLRGSPCHPHGECIWSPA